MSSLILTRFAQLYSRQTMTHLVGSRATASFTMNPVKTQEINKEFWTKNKDLNRPMSPHLSVYKPQLTSTLSIMHRITGVGASAVLYGAGIGALFTTSTSFPEVVGLIQNYIPGMIILGSKTIIGASLIYHTLNGVRHLFWDTGYGFQLKHLYLSGYIVVALTAVGAVILFIRG